MRILQIRFKNLNSLAGEWLIDLSHPDYVADGLFAITGPTGAGKSTLLDAICLALYGRTPRLPRIGKSSNEIMTRQQGECFAEVVFETAAGRFRCTWSQHRARRRPEGELQPPRHEIARADNGEVLQAKIRGVAAEIEATTGMDFERFTRSMLLAQGSFAAFLQAAPDERAPILEQITGTERYSQISMAVHTRRSAARQALDTLREQLARTRMLDADAEAALAAELAARQQDEHTLQAELATAQAALQWRREQRRLADARAALQAAHADWQTRERAFAPEAARLAAAHRALECAAAHASLHELRNAEATDHAALATLATRLPTATETAAAALAALRDSEAARSVAHHAQQHTAPLLREVRALDVRIAGLHAPLARVQAGLADTQARQNELKRQRQIASEQHAAQQAELNALDQALSARAADGDLVAQYAALSTAGAQLQRLHTQHVARQQAADAAHTQHATAQAAAAQADALAHTAQQAEATCQQALDAAAAALAAQLEHRPLAAWRAEHDAARTARSTLEQALHNAGDYAEARTAHADTTQRLATLAERITQLTTQQTALAERHAARQTEHDQLESQHDRLQHIATLASLRHTLSDGTPCPLCGATEHPFAHHAAPTPDATRERLQAVRAELKASHAALATLQAESAALASEHAATQTRQSELQARCARHAAQLTDFDPALAAQLDTTLLVTLSARQTALDAHLAALATRLTVAAQAEQELDTLRTARDRAQAEARQQHEAALHARHAAAHAQQHSASLTAEVTALATEHAAALRALQQDLAPWQVTLDEAAGLPAVLDRLAQRRTQWQEQSARQQSLRTALAALQQQIRHQDAGFDRSALERAQLDDERRHLADEQRTLLEQRQTLFGTQQPDAEEQRLAEALEAADAALTGARDAHSAAAAALAALTHEHETRTRQQQARAPRLRDAEQHFSGCLQQTGFADAAAWQAACLDEEERHALDRRARELADEELRLRTQAADLDRRIAAEAARALSPLPLDALQAEHAALQARHRSLQQELGALQQQYAANEALKQEHAAHQQALAAQQRECARWDDLHQLIGSADGKKYRNFAQGLTFARLIAHANRQLRRLNDRYLLTADPEQPLDLMVIDEWQAGERRSTRNLSGGESFIVSLALALGLSHMASQNVRVDSLFLDEGFGTLDEDALDTALDALASLQQDGKLIGVISHVPALKERIRTQITVTPAHGGTSHLHGPGCRRL